MKRAKKRTPSVSVTFRDEMSALLSHNEIVIPRRDLRNFCRCLYCDRDWNTEKYESCPSCGAPPERKRIDSGIRVMKLSEKEFNKR